MLVKVYDTKPEELSASAIREHMISGGHPVNAVQVFPFAELMAEGIAHQPVDSAGMITTVEHEPPRASQPETFRNEILDEANEALEHATQTLQDQRDLISRLKAELGLANYSDAQCHELLDIAEVCQEGLSTVLELNLVTRIKDLGWVRQPND